MMFLLVQSRKRSDVLPVNKNRNYVSTRIEDVYMTDFLGNSVTEPQEP
jgi:hypothetical protein